jgi:hypothetical protein
MRSGGTSNVEPTYIITIQLFRCAGAEAEGRTKNQAAGDPSDLATSPVARRGSLVALDEPRLSQSASEGVRPQRPRSLTQMFD